MTNTLIEQIVHDENSELDAIDQEIKTIKQQIIQLNAQINKLIKKRTKIVYAQQQDSDNVISKIKALLEKIMNEAKQRKEYAIDMISTDDIKNVCRLKPTEVRTLNKAYDKKVIKRFRMGLSELEILSSEYDDYYDKGPQNKIHAIAQDFDKCLKDVLLIIDNDL